MDDHPIRSLVMIVVLIFINALISAAEAALSSLNEANLRKASDEGDKTAANLLKLLGDEFEGRMKVSLFNVIEFLLITVNLIIGFVFSMSNYTVIRSYFAKITGRSETDFLVRLIMVCVIIVLIYVIVVVGVLFPKKLAIKNAEKKAYTYGKVLKGISYVLFPLIFIADRNTRFLLWLFRVKPEEIEENVTEEEIISIVAEGQENGVLEGSEAEMISNIIEFDNKVVRDIMTHRKKIVALDDETSMQEALHSMLEESYTRFPLYHENIDDIVGILHLKDVMRCHLAPELSGKKLREIATTPYFVPDTRNIDALLHDMQNSKVQMAVVIDEYGQTAGIITLEDILEEIVGEIQDEYDDEQDSIFDQGDDAFLVTGETSLEEIEEEIGMKFDEEDCDNYDTLNGLLISKLGRIPADGEKDTIDLLGFKFEIIETAHKMIQMVRISKNEEEPKTEE